MEQQLTAEQQAEAEKLLRLLKQLEQNEAFIAWKEEVYNVTVRQLEADLASKESDNLPEAVLRAKLKQLNSLKYMFEDVFVMAKMNLKETK